MEYAECRHPFETTDRKSLVVLADYVTLEAGTGCVHTAPGHGADDFETGVRYNLPIICPVDGSGKLTAEAGADFAGMFVFDANVPHHQISGRAEPPVWQRKHPPSVCTLLALQEPHHLPCDRAVVRIC